MIPTPIDAGSQRQHDGRDRRRAFVHLASRSPRRRQLLTEHGIEHACVVPEVDDAHLLRGQVAEGEWAAALAWFKAAAARHMIQGPPPGSVVLGADTVVYVDGRVIGQPEDQADAGRIIRLLEDGEHEVLTGVALLDPIDGRREIFVDRATVRVGRIGTDRIEEYLATGGWRGKAGAYNLFERIQAGWPIGYDGDPTTIMGLPMRVLPDRLDAFAAPDPGLRRKSV